MPARYAIYYAPPPGSPLARFGDAWLGRSAASGDVVARREDVDLGGMSPERLDAATAEPRRYGFHGTLKPPFALRPGTDLAGLVAAARAFAAARRPFLLPPLRLVAIGRFLALVPSARSPELDDLAAAAVRELDGFRAPPGDAELARRRRAGLSERQEAMLSAWGYPYVLDEFRFHLTLTGPLAPEEQAACREALVPLTADLCREPVPCAEVWLFGQSDTAAPFTMLERLPFGANGS